MFPFLKHCGKIHISTTFTTDVIMLTYEDLPLFQDTSQALLGHLRGRGKAVNPQKIQDPGTTEKLLGVVLWAQTSVDPEAVIGKMQAYPAP